MTRLSNLHQSEKLHREMNTQTDALLNRHKEVKEQDKDDNVFLPQLYRPMTVAHFNCHLCCLFIWQWFLPSGLAIHGHPADSIRVPVRPVRWIPVRIRPARRIIIAGANTCVKDLTQPDSSVTVLLEVLGDGGEVTAGIPAKENSNNYDRLIHTHLLL